ncbi:MAG TPA: SCO family protein [Longimicrobiales bacterium]
MEDRLMGARSAALPPAMSREEAVALTGLLTLFLVTAAWWALAFWPVPDGPAWLERTRYVCFGVTASGLPDGGGWVGLIAAPLGMLAMLLAGWWSGVRRLARRARSSRLLSGVFAVLGLGTALIVLGAATRVQQARALTTVPELAGGLPPETYPRLDRPSPPLALLAHDGIARSLEDFRGRAVLVTFAYAHCETVCPLVVKHVLAAQQTLGAAGERPVVLIVTLDPWRDTPSRLPAMAESWGLPEADAWVLGGAVADVEAALDAWEVPRSRDLVTGEVTHPSLTWIIDAAGRMAYASTGGADAIASLVRRL